MSDRGTHKTDLAVKRVEWRLSRVYHRAAQDIDKKLKEWEKGHQRREAYLRKQVAEGKMSKADFDAWMRGQVFQGQQWRARKEQIQQTLLHADQEAMRIVHNGKVDVFKDNANFMVRRIGRHTTSASFQMYDEYTVARLVERDPKILPMLPPEKAVLKDKAYTYYNKLVNGAITQGIIQGESVQKIAHRIAESTGESCYKSALRNARTAYTGAQNAGRIEGMHQAQRLGINVMKQWVSAHDGHTRDAHLHLDGQTKEVDEPFDSDFNDDIMYPCDPNGAPANVYNCRCTLIEVFPEYK